jgi:pimeloyl-ACP methyl ester carboxylesterase
MRAPLAVRTLGDGPPLLLVHGGVGPRATWATQEELAGSFRLVIPSRRGFAGSPAAARQDYEEDAADLEPLLADGHPHAVGFSYGGVGLALAVGRAPRRVRSLTLIEPPLFGIAAGHPDVAALSSLSAAYTSGGPGDHAAFERLAGVAEPAAADQLGPELDEARRLAAGLRMPDAAEPDLAAINAAGVPALVISGGHHPGLEVLCDALAGRLAARRERVAGAGHAVQRAAGFNDVLVGFLRAVEARSTA